jgi:hypothetical protein
MTREDYIVRAIEQAARAVGRLMARLFQLKDAAVIEEGLAEARREMGKLLGRDGAVTDAFTASELIAILRPIVSLDPARVGCIAVLLASQGTLCDRRDGAGAGDGHRAKALALLFEVKTVRGTFSTSEERTVFDELLASVDPADLPAESQERLLSYHESAGNYAAAEDLLFEMCEDDDLRPRAAAWGVAFFERMSARTDDDLARGGLSREDVEEGSRDIGRMLG